MVCSLGSNSSTFSAVSMNSTLIGKRVARSTSRVVCIWWSEPKPAMPSRHGCARYAPKEQKIQDGRIRRAPVILLVLCNVDGDLLSRSRCEHFPSSAYSPRWLQEIQPHALVSHHQCAFLKFLTRIRHAPSCIPDRGFTLPMHQSPSWDLPCNHPGPDTYKSNHHAQRDIEHCRKRLPVLKEAKRLILKSGERRVSPDETDGDQISPIRTPVCSRGQHSETPCRSGKSP
jgi:hypothetical protein